MGEVVSSGLTIRPLTEADWPAVRKIYRDGIATGHATFETDVPPWEAWDRGHLASPRLVAELEGQVVGWAALSPTSPRPVYRGVAEVSIYLAEERRGQGIGRTLLGRLVDESEASGIWTLQAGIFPENVASVRLHRALGFQDVGVRERVGRLDGRWRDVLLLERRSERVGR